MSYFNPIKVLNAQQMRWLDAETSKREPISSINLMERAATAIFNELIYDFGKHLHFVLFCGKGNNGGDGLVLARLLTLYKKEVTVFIPDDVSTASTDFLINLNRFKECKGAIIRNFEDEFENDENTICIDALFGTGIKLPLNEYYIQLIKRINKHYNKIISIDINSGLPCDIQENIDLTAINSIVTYCIHSPKTSLFYPETGQYCQKIKVVDIGLNKLACSEIESNEYYITDDVFSLLPARQRFAYKQKMGHVLVAAGSKGMAGAAFLCGKATMEVGAGLVTYACPEACVFPLQASFPEAMTLSNLGENHLIDLPKTLSNYAVLAVGPGIGTESATQKMLEELLKKCERPIVIDADALNCIAHSKKINWPVNAVITPHPGEFDRLTKTHKNSYDRLITQKELSVKHQIVIVLKGAYTCVALPDGSVYFNSSGSQAMAKAGSGDVLTGIIAGFMAQGLQSADAALLGVYVHGKSGEIAASKKGIYSTNATDLINNIHLCINQNI